MDNTKRFKLTKLDKSQRPTSDVWYADTVEEIAAKLNVLESYVQSFVSKNKKGHLSIAGHSCEDRQTQLTAKREQQMIDEAKQAAYEQARAEIEAELEAAQSKPRSKTKAAEPEATQSKPRSKTAADSTTE